MLTSYIDFKTQKKPERWISSELVDKSLLVPIIPSTYLTLVLDEASHCKVLIVKGAEAKHK